MTCLGIASFIPNSLAKELNVKRFTADSDVATIVIHSPVKNIVEELLNVSIYTSYVYVTTN